MLLNVLSTSFGMCYVHKEMLLQVLMHTEEDTAPPATGQLQGTAHATGCLDRLVRLTLPPVQNIGQILPMYVHLGFNSEHRSLRPYSPEEETKSETKP